ncbi:uncharacterized protein LOC120551654 [Perca fluviatilis]|uniref:uncharacterized protein LOC120551654 n=1 Tax=Perca fluviatilis TaxID=8168 RepID=UPI00196627E1|nr:uncharacterized protein LOC120551654 [Perca fluviatilis]
MLRRSPRLEEAGYYREERTPIISYRETCYRIFQRRKGQRGHHHESIGHDGNTSNIGDTQNHYLHHNTTQIPFETQTIKIGVPTQTIETGVPTQTIETGVPTQTIETGVPTQTNHTWTTAVKIISVLCILLLLALGITHYIHMSMHVKELQQEMEILQKDGIKIMQLKQINEGEEMLKQNLMMGMELKKLQLDVELLRQYVFIRKDAHFYH